MEKSFYNCGLWSQLVWMTMNITTYQLGAKHDQVSFASVPQFSYPYNGYNDLANVIDL